MPEKQTANAGNDNFRNDELFIEYAEFASRGETPEVKLPKQFTEDPDWRFWPGRVYRLLFEKNPQAACGHESSAEQVRKFLAGDIGGGRELLLPHLRFRRHKKREEPDFKDPVSALYRLLKSQPGESWFSADAFIRTASALPEISGAIDSDYSADYIYYETRGDYRNYLGDSGTRDEQRYLESAELRQQACIEPLCVNYLGSTLILGLTEARYNPWLESFSPWEGITELRLTHWGRFVLDHSREIPQWKSPGCIGYSDEGNLAVLKRDSPRCHMLLEKTGDEIAPGKFHICRESIYRACGNAADLEEIIIELQQSSDGPMPDSWDIFFDSLRKRTLMMESDENWILFQLPRSREITKELIENRDFDGVFLKVEGFRILIHNSRLEEFRRLLQKHGFFPQI